MEAKKAHRFFHYLSYYQCYVLYGKAHCELVFLCDRYSCSCLEKLMTLISVNITSELRYCDLSVIVVKLFISTPDRGK